MMAIYLRPIQLAAGMLLSLLVSHGLADSTINDTNKFAYAGNTGWINFRPNQPSNPEGVVFGEAFLSGNAYAANFGWIDFGDGIPTNQIQYQNDGNTDFGVNHDGTGNLSGYAYGANIGWIHFGWAATSDPNRPRVDLTSGEFAGYAYGANVGWINLGTANLITDSMHCVDLDDDGIADPWEQEHFGNLTTATATSNADGDPVSDLGEYLAATAPEDPESFLDIVTHQFNDDGSMVSIEFTTKPHRRYQAQWSGELGISPDQWQDASLGMIVPDAGSTTTRSVNTPANTRRFIRIAPVKPLQP